MPDDIIKIADEFRKALLRRERKAAVRLVAAYGQAWARLNRELAKLTAQIQEARAKGEVVNQFWLARQQRYFALLQQVSDEMRKFSETAETTITRQQSAAVKAGISDSAALMEAAAGGADVGTVFNKLPVAAVEDLVGTLGDGSPLRTLLDQIPRAGRAIVEQGLIEGVALGRNPRAIARQIREGLGGNMVRALTIARTETLRAYRQASIQNYQANSDVVSGWYWRSSRSRRSCSACTALDGTFWPVSQPMRPHPRCRCTLIPAVRGVTVDRGVDWFKEQPPEVQRAIIGTDKGYELYKRGELKLEDFVGLQRSAQWGDTYHQLSVKRALAGEAAFPKDAVKPPDTIPPIIQPPAPRPSIMAYAQRPPRNVQVRYEGSALDAVTNIVGRAVSNEELAWAVGALDDAVVTVHDVGDPYITIDHPHVETQARYIRRDSAGRLFIENSAFFKANSAPPGVGIRSFARQVFGARNLGATRIETFAIGDARTPQYKGYYVWALFGYNAPLTAADRALLPRGLRGSKDLHELFDRGGAAYWEANGDDREMVFDLRARSKSLRRLRQYVERKDNE